MLRRRTEQQYELTHWRERSGSMTTVAVHHEEGNGIQRFVWAANSVAGLALAALVSYELTTRILTSAISSGTINCSEECGPSWQPCLSVAKASRTV